MGLADAGKRILLGRKLKSAQLGETLLPKRMALPVFASDAFSSVAYAGDEIFLVLSMGGLAAYAFSWQIALGVVLVMVTVVASYRQNVRAYPSGGGDYEIASVNLGRNAGITVASALLVDYVLTVAVSVSAGVQNATAALPWLHDHEAVAASVIVIVLASINLRGAKESGKAFAIPAYLFVFSIVLMAGWGYLRHLSGDLPQVESAEFELRPEDAYAGGAAGLAMAFLLARAFASGCAALTGVEAISNGVPAFQKPKSKNAATTLLMLGAVSITMLLSIVSLANLTELRYAHDPANQLLLDGEPVGEGYQQETVIGQIAAAVFDHAPPLFYLVIACTGLILMLAANTAFNGFPVLGSILARDGFLPRQLDTRGDRLAFSNGILVLALAAVLLILAFDAHVTALIQLYLVGVFLSFNLSQLGMLRHWTRLLRDTTDPAERRRMMRARAVNGFGLFLTAMVLIVIVGTKFLAGAWITLIAVTAIFLVMRGIRRHYDSVSHELEIDDSDVALPSRVHAVVLVGRLHKPTMRALTYARVSRPNTIEAVTVEFDPEQTAALLERWDELGIPIALKVLDSPYRELVRPVVRYVKSIRRQSPRDIVSVFIPEYVVGRWWEQLLHNQTALRLKGRLLFTPGVMVTSVPYQLASSKYARERAQRVRPVPGEVRRGIDLDAARPVPAVTPEPKDEHD